VQQEQSWTVTSVVESWRTHYLSGWIFQLWPPDRQNRACFLPSSSQSNRCYRDRRGLPSPDNDRSCDRERKPMGLRSTVWWWTVFVGEHHSCWSLLSLLLVLTSSDALDSILSLKIVNHRQYEFNQSSSISFSIDAIKESQGKQIFLFTVEGYTFKHA